MLLLRPPCIYVKACLVEADEFWLVKKAIYGLKESPLLWSKERDRRLEKMTVEVQSQEDPTVKEEYFVKKLQSDPNTWHILKKGDEDTNRDSKNNQDRRRSVLRGRDSPRKRFVVRNEDETT